MKIISLLTILSVLFLNSCSKVRESAGVTRKSINELEVVENPLLIIPPEFNLLPPNQLKGKNIDTLENDLAEEILFGLNKDSKTSNSQLSTMSKILEKSEALEVSPSIREEIDKDFSDEISSKKIFSNNWKNEIEILDAIKESERIRNQKFDGNNLNDGDIPITTKIIEKKKRKRFILF